VRVLIACERSGMVRRAFRSAGHAAWSCDLEPADDGSVFHFQGDVRNYLDDDWELLIAHPPCTYLSASGLHWNKRRPGRSEQTEAAVEFALALWNAPVKRVALENPIGLLSTRIRPPDQIIQPYQFGDDASKATCLWLSGLPLLRPTKRLEGRWVLYKGKYVERWANQTDSGQNRLPPSEDRARLRSETYPGISAAMAEQWGAAAKEIAAYCETLAPWSNGSETWTATSSTKSARASAGRTSPTMRARCASRP